MRRYTTARPAPRHDDWTPQRQLDFLEMLAGTGSVSRSARAVGMSRESAYRLRLREPDGLFAAAWQRALTPNHLLAAQNGKLMKVTSALSRQRAVSRRDAPRTTSCDDQHRELEGAHPVIAARLRTTL